MRIRNLFGDPSLLLTLAALVLLGGCGSLPRVVVLNDPLSAEEHIRLGYAYEQSGDLEGARREYLAALENDPRHPGALFNLGNIYAEEGRYKKSEGAYRRLLRMDPWHPGANNNLASIYIHQGKKLTAAESMIEKAMAADPGRLAYYLDSQAQLLLRRDRPMEAQLKLREAETAPGSGESAFKKQHSRTRRQVNDAVASALASPETSKSKGADVP